MGVKQTKLTDEQFNLLNTTDQWIIEEVPKEYWPKIPGIQRLNDTFSIMASGCATPTTLNGLSALAGLDVLCLESKPKKNEPEGNAYHYAIQDRTDGKYLIGPFRSETIVSHWFEADDLDRYWQ